MDNRKAVCIKMEPENHKYIKILAAEKGCSASDIYNIAVRKFIGEVPKK